MICRCGSQYTQCFFILGVVHATSIWACVRIVVVVFLGGAHTKTEGEPRRCGEGTRDASTVCPSHWCTCVV